MQIVKTLAAVTAIAAFSACDEQASQRTQQAEAYQDAVQSFDRGLVEGATLDLTRPVATQVDPSAALQELNSLITSNQLSGEQLQTIAQTAAVIFAQAPGEADTVQDYGPGQELMGLLAADDISPTLRSTLARGLVMAQAQMSDSAAVTAEGSESQQLQAAAEGLRPMLQSDSTAEAIGAARRMADALFTAGRIEGNQVSTQAAALQAAAANLARSYGEAEALQARLASGVESLEQVLEVLQQGGGDGRMVGLQQLQQQRQQVQQQMDQLIQERSSLNQEVVRLHEQADQAEQARGEAERQAFVAQGAQRYEQTVASIDAQQQARQAQAGAEHAQLRAQLVDLRVQQLESQAADLDQMIQYLSGRVEEVTGLQREQQQATREARQRVDNLLAELTRAAESLAQVHEQQVAQPAQAALELVRQSADPLDQVVTRATGNTAGLIQLGLLHRKVHEAYLLAQDIRASRMLLDVVAPLQEQHSRLEASDDPYAPMIERLRESISTAQQQMQQVAGDARQLAGEVPDSAGASIREAAIVELNEYVNASRRRG